VNAAWQRQVVNSSPSPPWRRRVQALDSPQFLRLGGEGGVLDLGDLSVRCPAFLLAVHAALVYLIGLHASSSIAAMAALAEVFIRTGTENRAFRARQAATT